MMNIQLKERKEGILNELKITDTFKIPESSFIFMKVDVEGLTVRPKSSPGAEPEKSEVIKVLIPEEKTAVICLSTGKAQFLNLNEKVQIVNLQCTETLEKENHSKEM